MENKAFIKFFIVLGHAWTEKYGHKKEILKYVGLSLKRKVLVLRFEIAGFFESIWVSWFIFGDVSTPIFQRRTFKLLPTWLSPHFTIQFNVFSFQVVLTSHQSSNRSRVILHLQHQIIQNHFKSFNRFPIINFKFFLWIFIPHWILPFHVLVLIFLCFWN